MAKEIKCKPIRGRRSKNNNISITTEPTDGPVTRSKLKALSNRSSIDGLASSQDISMQPTPIKRGARSTRSMTRSPSPTNSVVSTASTTVVRNTLKRRGSNRIKKPSKVLSPTNIIEKSSVEELSKEQPNGDDSGTRYNLRSRRTTLKKDQVLDTLFETAASLTPSAAKKGRKPANNSKKNGLYKIDEAVADSKHSKSDENKNEFQFSNPHNARNIGKTAKYRSDSDSENHEKHKDGDSSFTFSPPHKK